MKQLYRTYPGGPPTHVHVAVSHSSVNLTVIGWTGRPALKAPLLNGAKAFLNKKLIRSCFHQHLEVCIQ